MPEKDTRAHSRRSKHIDRALLRVIHTNNTPFVRGFCALSGLKKPRNQPPGSKRLIRFKRDVDGRPGSPTRASLPAPVQRKEGRTQVCVYMLWSLACVPCAACVGHRWSARISCGFLHCSPSFRSLRPLALANEVGRVVSVQHLVCYTMLSFSCLHSSALRHTDSTTPSRTHLHTYTDRLKPCERPARSASPPPWPWSWPPRSLSARC